MVMPQPATDLSEKRRAAGSLGGIQNYLRYGHEEMVRRGKLGGRPRAKTIDDIIGQQSASSNNDKKGGMSSTANLKEMKRLVKLRIKMLGRAGSE